jgi:SAM-dependent methyltransferase
VAFVVGDARNLPFRDDCFDTAFSYSVLQHLEKDVVRAALAEIGRVTRPGRTIRVQIANVLGAKQLLNHATEWIRLTAGRVAGRRRARYGFRVRPWTPREVMRTFSSILGPSVVSADGFFSLNAQPSDADLLSPAQRQVVRVSSTLCRLSERVPPLAHLADSLMVESTNAK